MVLCEDEWIATLGFEIRSFQDYRQVAGRCRELAGPLVTNRLRLGVSVVLDFPANTAPHRAWARSLFGVAGADHVLHWLEGTDAECLANVRRRNDEKPAGVYFGAVSDETFNGVLPHIVPPAPEEGFNVVRRSVTVAGP